MILNSFIVIRIFVINLGHEKMFKKKNVVLRSNDLLAKMILGHLWTFFWTCKDKLFPIWLSQSSESIHLDCRPERQWKCTKGVKKRRTKAERERLSDTEEWRGKRTSSCRAFRFLSLRGTLCFFLNKASGKKKQSGHAHPDLVTCVCSPWISIFGWRVEKWEVIVLSAHWFLSCVCVCVWQSEPCSGGVGADAGLYGGQVHSALQQWPPEKPSGCCCFCSKKGSPRRRAFYSRHPAWDHENTEDNNVGMGM